MKEVNEVSRMEFLKETNESAISGSAIEKIICSEISRPKKN
jgi:hypothetical protein